MESVRAAIDAEANAILVPQGGNAPDSCYIDQVWRLDGTEDYYVARDRYWESCPEGGLMLAHVKGGAATIIDSFAYHYYSLPRRVTSRQAPAGDGIWIEVITATRRGSHWPEIYVFDGTDVRYLFRSHSWSAQIPYPDYCYVYSGNALRELELTYVWESRTEILRFPWDPDHSRFVKPS
jgi:hypothetical protein